MDKSLELFADLMENLTLKDEEFQPERDVVAEREDGEQIIIQWDIYNLDYLTMLTSTIHTTGLNWIL